MQTELNETKQISTLNSHKRCQLYFPPTFTKMAQPEIFPLTQHLGLFPVLASLH